MTGTWFGTLEDPVANMHTTSVIISGTSITEMRVNDNVTGRTGTITPRSAQVLAFTLDDGTQGGFFLDPSAAHAAFVDDKFNFGVVQRGLGVLPAYADADIDATWSGIAVTTTDFDNFSTATSGTTCTHPTCNTGGETVTFGSVDAFGRYLGGSVPSGAFVAAFLSPDKQFAGTYACHGLSFPGGCEFTAWRKQ